MPTQRGPQPWRSPPPAGPHATQQPATQQPATLRSQAHLFSCTGQFGPGHGRGPGYRLAQRGCTRQGEGALGYGKWRGLQPLRVFIYPAIKGWRPRAPPLSPSPARERWLPSFRPNFPRTAATQHRVSRVGPRRRFASRRGGAGASRKAGSAGHSGQLTLTKGG